MDISFPTKCQGGGSSTTSGKGSTSRDLPTTDGVAIQFVVSPLAAPAPCGGGVKNCAKKCFSRHTHTQQTAAEATHNATPSLYRFASADRKGGGVGGKFSIIILIYYLLRGVSTSMKRSTISRLLALTVLFFAAWKTCRG